MQVSQLTLLGLLQRSVLEIRFYRRTPKLGWSNARRMLCTNDRAILDSMPGRIALHFRTPTKPPAYNWYAKGLVCSWDLLWQDFRMIPADSCDVVTVIPTQPPDKFWNYFNQYLQAMSPSQKLEFMDH